MILIANVVAAWLGISTIIIAAQISNAVQLFSIVVGAIIVIVAGLFTIRAKNAEWWQQSYEGIKAAHSELLAKYDVLTKENAELRAENATLKALPNYDIVVGMLKRTMDDHKIHSDAQIEAIKQLTNVIEERLPPIDDVKGHSWA